MRSRLLQVACLVMLTLGAGLGSAQAEVVISPIPSKGARPAAKKRLAARAFARAQQFYQKGDLEAALFAAEASFKHLPNASTCLIRAVILGELGRQREAFAAYLLASDLAPTRDEVKLVEDGLKRHGSALKPPMGWLVVVVEPVGAKVTIDEVTFDAPRAVGVGVGRHKITVEAEGFVTVRGGFTVNAGHGQRLEYTLREAPKEPRPPNGDPPKPDPPDIRKQDPPPSGPGAAELSLMIGGGVLVLAGVGFHVWAMDASGDTQRYSKPIDGVDEADRIARHRDAADATRTASALTYSLYGVGGAVLIAGIVLMLVSDDETEAPAASVAPVLVPGGGGFTMSGAF